MSAASFRNIAILLLFALAASPADAMEYRDLPGPTKIVLRKFVDCASRKLPTKIRENEFSYCDAKVSWDPNGSSELRRCIRKHDLIQVESSSGDSPSETEYQILYRCSDYKFLHVNIITNRHAAWLSQVGETLP